MKAEAQGIGKWLGNEVFRRGGRPGLCGKDLEEERDREEREKELHTFTTIESLMALEKLS